MSLSMNLPKGFKCHVSDRPVARWTPVPDAPMYRARYCGVRKRLYGKIALLQVPCFTHTPTGRDAVPYVMAQFNDMTQPEAFGWSAFDAKDFTHV